MTKNLGIYRSLIAIIFCCIFWGSASSFADSKPSFDCAKAKTEVEKLICGSDELAALDVELSETYSKLNSGLDEKGKADLKSSQIEWIKKRASLVVEGVLPADSSEDATRKKIENLKKNYDERIANVKARLEKLPSKESEPLSSDVKVQEHNETAKSGKETKTGIGRPKLIMEELYSLGSLAGNYDSNRPSLNDDINYKDLWESSLAGMGIVKDNPMSGGGHYDTALDILKQIRTELGENSDYQKIWAENQERVFSARGEDAEGGNIPVEPSGSALPKRAHSDFLYQKASWHFYRGEGDQALDTYRQIETLNDAPVRGYASYMVMRLLNNSGNKSEAYKMSEKILSDKSLKYVHALTANYRFVIMYYDGPPEASEDHLRWLSGIVKVNPTSSSEIKLRVSDYYDALEQLGFYFPLYDPYTHSIDWWLDEDYKLSENGSMDYFLSRMQAVKKIAPTDELIDWIQSSTAYNVFASDWLWALHDQDNAYWEENKRIVAHAWNRWKKGDGGEWLQIAAKRVHPKDDISVEILKASMPFFSSGWEKETKDYKNWLFELWENNVRILLGRGEVKEVMSLISNHPDFGRLPYSRWSLGDSSHHTGCLSLVVRWLVYTGQTDSARECLAMILKMYPDGFNEWRALLAKSWEEMPLSYEHQYGSYSGLSSSALWDQIVNVLPSNVLYDLADNKNKSEAERALLIRTALTRAIILGYDNDILEKYALLAAKLHPAIKDQILSSVANRDRDDCIDLLLRMPRFRPVPNPERLNSWAVNTDEKAMQDLTAIDVYNHNDNNWWRRYDFKFFEDQIVGAALIIPSQPDSEIFKMTDQKNSEFKPYIEKQKAFLAQHPYKKMIDMKEIAALEAAPAAPQFLTEAVVARESRFYWKFWQSEETRNKHAANLHYAVRTIRYGCNNCGSHAAYSKKAYRILHKQYGKTTWAKATPYWFK